MLPTLWRHDWQNDFCSSIHLQPYVNVNAKEEKMKKSIFLLVVFFTFSLFVLVEQQANAQIVYGVSAVEENPEFGLVLGYSYEELDYYAYYYYDAYIEGYLYENNTIMDAGYDLGGDYAEVDTETNSNEDSDYVEISDHFLLPYYYDPEFGYYYDPFGFSLYDGGYYGGSYTFYGCDCPKAIYDDFIYLGYTSAAFSTPCRKTPTLSGPSTTTRGQSATYTVGNTCRVIAISNWQFSDGANPPVIRTTNTGASNWTGTMVISGTVSVTVVQGGRTTNLMKGATVAARTSGFSFTATSPAEVPNGSSCGSRVMSIPSPPASGQLFGEFCLGQPYNTTFALLNDGPNKGYRYLTSITNDATYKYVISPDAKNTSSTFYLAQCGNYNATTNPSGFISGA